MSSQVKKITKEGGTMTVHLGCESGENNLTGVDCVLYAIGRSPNTSDLGLDIAVCMNPLFHYKYNPSTL